MSGSLRIPCVYSMLLCKLFCSILRLADISIQRGEIFLLFLFLISGVLSVVLGTHGAMQHVGLCSAHIAEG